MICRVTGAPIYVQDPIVVLLVGDRYLPNHQTNNQLNNKFTVCSLPIHAEYDDYGGWENETTDEKHQAINKVLAAKAIELEYIRPMDHGRWDIENTMMMHRDAFDLMMEHPNFDEWPYYGDDYATYGDRRAAAKKEANKRIEALAESYAEKWKDRGKEVADRMIQSLIADTWRTSMLWDAYRMDQNDQYIWNTAITKFGDECGELYVKYVAHLRDRSNVLHWELGPSCYGSQTNDDIMGEITMHQIAIEKLLEIKRKYHAEEEY
jgi:hypothetical protein